MFPKPILSVCEVIEMTEFVVKVPGVKIDELTISELREDIISVVKLRLARVLILRRLNKLLERSELTDEDCLRLSESAEDSIIKEWEGKGWL